MASRIHSARSEASLSQSKLAEHLGVDRSAVAQWERVDGGTNPRIDHLKEIADITGVRFEWLAIGRGAQHARRRWQPHTLQPDQAKNDFEEKCLALLRRLPQSKQSLASQLLAELARG